MTTILGPTAAILTPVFAHRLLRLTRYDEVRDDATTALQIITKNERLPAATLPTLYRLIRHDHRTSQDRRQV
ncbi:MAG: hypothetical protein FE835_18970 [Gammaproteobacteria bacterium]|nr:hypothetical protein [Gammaproteobacteria bacterium]